MTQTPDRKEGEANEESLLLASSGVSTTQGQTRFTGGKYSFFDENGEFNPNQPGGVAPWVWQTSTVDADPGAGNFRTNNATPASVSAIFISEIDNFGLDWAGAFALNGIGASIQIASEADLTETILYRVTGVVDNTNYFRFNVTHEDSSTNFTNFVATEPFRFMLENHGVNGPGASTDNAAAVYDSTSGRLLKDSGVLLGQPGSAVLTLGATSTLVGGRSTAGTGAVTASGAGGVAFGHTLEISTGTCLVSSSGAGALVFGDTSCTSTGNATLSATTSGSFVHGNAGSTGGTAGLITATAIGATASGYAQNGGTVQASGEASFALGRVLSTASCVASGLGAGQIGIGTNSEDTSWSVGDPTADGLRLLGSGVAASPQNGDFWIASTDVIIRSGGANITIGPGGSGDVTGGSTSVVGEVATYSSTSGKAIGRADTLFGSSSPTVGTRTLGANALISGARITTGGVVDSSGTGSTAIGAITQTLGTATVTSTGVGSLASGSVVSATSASAIARVDATGAGATAIGRADNTGVGTASIVAGSDGSLAGGRATGVASNISTASSIGSFAFGNAESGGIIRTVTAANGGFATGYAVNSAIIEATANGAFASGWGDAAGSNIRATERGAHAIGRASTGGEILASGTGCFAMGRTGTANDIIAGTSDGSFAGGSASGNNILASGNGCFAFGFSSSGGIISTSGANGCMAFGHSGGGAISATADGAIQLTPGTNNIADTLQVGDTTDGLRFQPGGVTSTVDGSFWVDGSGNVTVRTGGANVDLGAVGGGDVTAAANIGDNLLVRGDGAVKGVQNSGITVDDSDNITGAGTYNGVTVEAKATLHKTITVEDPSASENLSMFYTNIAITVTQVTAVILGSTSVSFDIEHGTSRATATGTGVIGTDEVADSTTTGNITTAGFADATIPADSFVWLSTSALSGTPSQLMVTVEYTED